MNAILPIDTTAPRAVNLAAGTTNSRLSSQWWTRPDDQRYLSLADLHSATVERHNHCRADVVDVTRLQVSIPDPETNALAIQRPDGPEARPSHWAFGQTCGLLGVPAGYLRRLPSELAAINLQYAMRSFRSENVKLYERTNGGPADLLAATGPDYGRIPDHEVVGAVMRAADPAIWKVPGTMKFGTGIYDPSAAVTKQTTTLYASDRDIWLFLCDDQHPIEAGKLPNGDPDLIFRGLMAWNSEVGSKTLGVATMYLRAVCQNRMLWGVEGFQEVSVRHSKFAPQRFAGELVPALESYAIAATDKVRSGIDEARRQIVASTDEEAVEFLNRRAKMPEKIARECVAQVLAEEGRPARSIWDLVQGITARARSIEHTDARVDMERVAGRMLDAVSR